jgi:hypothetical protein
MPRIWQLSKELTNLLMRLSRILRLCRCSWTLLGVLTVRSLHSNAGAQGRNNNGWVVPVRPTRQWPWVQLFVQLSEQILTAQPVLKLLLSLLYFKDGVQIKMSTTKGLSIARISITYVRSQKIMSSTTLKKWKLFKKKEIRFLKNWRRKKHSR